MAGRSFPKGGFKPVSSAGARCLRGPLCWGARWRAINNSWQGQMPDKHPAVGCWCTNGFSPGRAWSRRGKGRERAEGEGRGFFPNCSRARKDPAGKEMCSSDEGSSRLSLFVASIRGAPCFFYHHHFLGASAAGQMLPVFSHHRPRCRAPRPEKNNKEDFTAVVLVGGGEEKTA